MGDELSAMARKFGFKEYPRGSVPVMNPRGTGETGVGSASAPTPRAAVDDRTRVCRAAAAGARDEQSEQHDRVAHRIEGAILAFFATRAVDAEFYADELRVYVAAQCGLVAPDSARRIASSMKPHAINFVCINRARSLYRIIPKGEKP